MIFGRCIQCNKVLFPFFRKKEGEIRITGNGGWEKTYPVCKTCCETLNMTVDKYENVKNGRQDI